MISGKGGLKDWLGCRGCHCVSYVLVCLAVLDFARLYVWCALSVCTKLLKCSHCYVIDALQERCTHVEGY